MKTRTVQGFFLAVLLMSGAGSATAVSIFDKTQADQGISAFKSGNYKYARTWLSTQAAADNPQAWYYLGRMYQEGLGGFVVDTKRAEKLYHQSAEQGVPEAMLALADLYSRGSGVKPNLAMVQIWHEQAARAGNIDGMFLLGQDLSGKSGLPADYNRARIWFEQAASAGHGEAMRALGDLYRNGQGVDVSMIEALMWYRLAVKAGSVDAKTGETLLSRILPAGQQSDADNRAREWEVLTGRAPSAPVQQTAIEVKKTSDNRNDIKAFLPLATASLK
ncbi:MAG: tetratricopeptide repeat protein [bacterium]|nr:tetratricopeptide repeat protein [bacterium]